MRREVVEFANALEARLAENDHKGGWDELGCMTCLERVEQNVDEIYSNIDEGLPFDEEPVLDAAAYLLFLRDNERR
jgi:hypothetical protein